jgi:hypothetical protein
VRLVHDDKVIQNNIVADYLTGQKAAADKTASDYLTNLKTTADKNIADYLVSVKATVDKAAVDYLTGQKAAADKTASDYLTNLKTTADKNIADYLISQKSAAGSLTPSTSTTSTSIYVKTSNIGATLPDSAKLGYGTNDWACTKDTKTGLTWEVKTIDGGLRDKNNVYTNYWVDGHGPTDDGPNNYGKSGNSDVFVTDVNAQNLCGYADWRLPTQNELKTLIYCSGDACQYAYVTINTVYFPNTHGSEYWTSSTSAGYYAVPYYVYFGSDGYNGVGAMSDKHYIRLVRGNN